MHQEQVFGELPPATMKTLATGCKTDARRGTGGCAFWISSGPVMLPRCAIQEATLRYTRHCDERKLVHIRQAESAALSVEEKENLLPWRDSAEIPSLIVAPFPVGADSAYLALGPAHEGPSVLALYP